MKLLLTSLGITNKTIENKFIEMVGKRPEEMTVAYVPTAINLATALDKRWAIDSLRKLDDMKVGIIDIVDFSAIPKENWLPRFESADVIYVEGGTPAYLKSEMEKAGLIELFNTILADKVYVGCSAGSNIMGEKNIKSTKEEPGYKILDGFRLVNFSIRPHFGEGGKTFFTEDLIQEISNQYDSTFYAIDDNTAIAVEDGKVEVISEGKWGKFDPKNR